jgi:hypothetical protein
MLKFNLVKVLCLTSLLALPMSSAMAMEEARIYGSQLMTQQELQLHRQEMRTAKTSGARALIREKNHERMRLRAEQKGINLPETPPAQPGNMNQHDRSGMGSGGGNR